MTSAVIFDIDGTLVDSVDLHAEAWQEAFRHFGRDIPYDEIRGQIGKGGDQLIPVFLSRDELDRFGKALDKYRGDLFKRQYLPKVRAFPGVRELFLRLRGDGIRIALSSSAKPEEVEVYKKIADIADLVDATTSKGDVEQSKPHPDVFDAALEKLQPVAIDEIVVVGDSPYDAEAAAKAGLPTVGVLCGGFAEADLRRAGCVAIFDGPEDLLRRYEDSPLAPTAVPTARRPAPEHAGE
jgi:HAD superfamily hydrolase (TIGR01549 family)